MTIPAPLLEAAEADIHAMLDGYPFGLDDLRDNTTRCRLKTRLLRMCLQTLADQAYEIQGEDVPAYSINQLAELLNRDRATVLHHLRKRDA